MNINKKKNINEIPTFQIITLGETGVGKTSMIKRYVYDTFDFNNIATVGLSFSFKDITLKNNALIKIKLVDTGGQEKYRSLCKSYFKNSNGVLFVYAKNNQYSFDRIKDWIAMFNENSNGKKDIPIFLVESKDDLERVVDEVLSENFAKENKFIFKKISCCKDNNSVNELFSEMGELLYKYYVQYNKKNFKQTGVKLNENEKKKKSQCCLFKNELDNDIY